MFPGGTLWTDFKYLEKKRIYKKLCVVCSEIPFFEDSRRVENSQIDLHFGSVWLFSVWYDFLLKDFGADFNMLFFKYCK